MCGIKKTVKKIKTNRKILNEHFCKYEIIFLQI